MTNKTIDEKLNEGRSYRNIDISRFERRAEGEDMTVEGYATVFNEP